MKSMVPGPGTQLGITLVAFATALLLQGCIGIGDATYQVPAFRLDGRSASLPPELANEGIPFNVLVLVGPHYNHSRDYEQVLRDVEPAAVQRTAVSDVQEIHLTLEKTPLIQDEGGSTGLVGIGFIFVFPIRAGATEKQATGRELVLWHADWPVVYWVEQRGKDIQVNEIGKEVLRERLSSSPGLTTATPSSQRSDDNEFAIAEFWENLPWKKSVSMRIESDSVKSDEVMISLLLDPGGVR